MRTILYKETHKIATNIKVKACKPAFPDSSFIALNRSSNIDMDMLDVDAYTEIDCVGHILTFSLARVIFSLPICFRKIVGINNKIIHKIVM